MHELLGYIFEMFKNYWNYIEIILKLYIIYNNKFALFVKFYGNVAYKFLIFKKTEIYISRRILGENSLQIKLCLLYST